MKNVWNETLELLRKDSSYCSMFHMMERFGNDTAAEMTDKNGKEISRTYREYVSLSQSACGNLQSLGIGDEGKIIGLIYDTCMDWPVLMWGILMSGNIPLLLNPLMDPQTLTVIMKEATAESYVSVKPVAGSDAKYIPAEEILRPGQPGEEKWGRYVALCTSGTTGNSRIFLYDSQTIANHMLSFDEAKKVHPDMPFIEDKPCKLLAFLPFHHVFGFSVVYVLYSCTGKTLVYMKDKSVNTILGTCQKHGVTHLYCIPMFFNALANGIVNQLDGKDIHKLPFFVKDIIKRKTLGTKIRSMITGGGHVPESTLDIINSVGYPLCNGFGMTETGIISVERSLDPAQRIKGSIGTPFTLTEWKIDSPDEIEGELLIRGGALYSASMVDGKIVPRDTSAWFATGDVIRKTPDGLYITGRCKDVIIGASGENIYPEEIEDTFSEISGIKNFCILGLNNGNYEDVAIIVEADSQIDRTAVISEIRSRNDRLPLAQRPVKVLFSQTALPLSGSMKIKRQVLRKDIEDGTWICEKLDIYKKENVPDPQEESIQIDPVITDTDSAAAVPADNEQFRQILDDVKKQVAADLLLEIDSIGDDDHYVEVLGADSLDMFSIFSALADKYDIEITEEDMMKLENCNRTADFIYRKLNGEE